MVRFEVISRPITIEAYEVKKVLGPAERYHNSALVCILENGWEVPIVGEIAVGDLARYDVRIDDYKKFDFEEAFLNPNLKFVE